MRHAVVVLTSMCAACVAEIAPNAPDSYEFTGRGGDSSVSYSGQVFRQLLIEDLAIHLGGVTERLDSGAFPVAGAISSELDFYLSFDSETSGQLEMLFSTDPSADQAEYDDVSSGKDLYGKLAGNDHVGQHRDWSTQFSGWDHDGVTSPESLVRHWVAVIDEQAVAYNGGAGAPVTAGGHVSPDVFVTAQGHDLRQLLEKFLRGAVAFSQAADDYLDDDVDGEGLLSDHSDLVAGEAFTELEHAWDEGFGYFGASRAFGTWSLEEIADGVVDVDDSGGVDLLSEVCFGHSRNTAKRDLGAAVATQFSADAWAGFASGRQLLADTDRALTDDELEVLRGLRDDAVSAWESALAATAVHYINEVLADMALFGTEAYDFGAHAKHWSELKGFALAFQFNPRSPLSDADFRQLHDQIGAAPALDHETAAAVSAYAADLIAARSLLATAYGFDADNLGDADGQGGW